MNNKVESSLSAVSKRVHWQSHIDKWKESKISQPMYCDQAGINYNTFVYWRGLLRSESERITQNSFTSIKVSPSNHSGSDTPRAIQIKLVSGHTVYIPTSIDIKDIVTLVQSLGCTYA